jgi:Uncharacterized low-complexity proteins
MDIISKEVYENVTFDRDCAVEEVLTGAKFIRCSFQGMDFENITTRKCIFSECNLQKADLRGANLSFAILTQASLCGAKLQDAIVDGVDFKSANIKGTFMDYTQAVSFARSFGIIID